VSLVETQEEVRKLEVECIQVVVAHTQAEAVCKQALVEAYKLEVLQAHCQQRS
jgi:hypothetical protein